MLRTARPWRRSAADAGAGCAQRLFNALGAVPWGGTWAGVGHLAGDHIETIYHAVGRYSLYLLAAAAFDEPRRGYPLGRIGGTVWSRGARVDRFVCRISALGGRRHLAELSGELGFESADGVTRQLEPLWASGTLVMLDLSRLTFADSSCIRMLVLARRAARAHNASLRLVAPPAWLVRWLHIAGVNDLFDIRRSTPTSSAPPLTGSADAGSSEPVPA